MTSGRFLAGDRRPLQSYRTKGWNSEGTLVRVYAGGVMREATVGVAVPDTGENSVTRAGKAVHRRQALTGPPPRQAGRRKKYPGLSLCPPSCLPWGRLIGCTHLLARELGSLAVWSFMGQPPRLKAERAGYREEQRAGGWVGGSRIGF